MFKKWLAAVSFIALGLSSIPAHADKFDTILAKGTLRVVVFADVPPFGSTNANRELEGFDIDLAKLLAKDLGVKLELVPATAANRIPYLLTDRADINIAAMSVTSERAKQVMYSAPYADTSLAVYGPKALACINGLPPALSSRCIPVPMFRSPPGSLKPRLRVEADRERWQALRDGLHGIAMEHGEEWLGLPGRQDVVPEMSGRNFELWQPLLAIAAWFEEQGAGKMLAIMQEHALRSIEQNREASTPPDDELLLQALARFIQGGTNPTAADILATVQEEDASTFRNWSPRAVSTHLGRYGIRSRKSHGRHLFSPDESDLLRVQTNYSIPLGFNPAPPTSTPPNAPPDNVPQRAPHTPGSHRGGAHGVHGAHPSEVKR